jgi:hypothetical protein
MLKSVLVIGTLAIGCFHVETSCELFCQFEWWQRRISGGLSNRPAECKARADNNIWVMPM